MTVNFDDAKAEAGKSADDIYLDEPRVHLRAGPWRTREGGEFPDVHSSCGTLVDTAPNAPSAPHVARLVCGGTPEFPDPPVLFGKLTAATRTRVVVKVGDSGNGGHVMRLSRLRRPGTAAEPQPVDADRGRRHDAARRRPASRRSPTS